MKSGIILYIVSTRENKEQYIEQWKEQITSDKNLHIVEESINFDKEKLEEDLINAIKFAQKNEILLIIPSLDEVQRNLKFWKIIEKYKVPFRVFDMPDFDIHNLPFYIQIMEYQHQKTSIKIKKGQKNSNKKLGNPNLGKDNNQAKRKRILAAAINESNTIARKKVFQLKKEQELSYNRIAKELNEAGLTTRRGKEYAAKTVERLYKSHKKLQENYKKNKVLEDITETRKEVTRKKLDIKSFPNHANFEKQLHIEFRSPSTQDFKLQIVNNKNEKCFEKDYKKGTIDLKIDFVDDTNMLPGIHYLCISAKEFREYNRSFYFMKNLV